VAVRSRFLTFAIALVAGAVTASPALAATTWYASPVGSGAACTQAAPCALKKAAEEEAQNGDGVVLEPGTYTLTESLGVNKAINIGGETGAAATVVKTTSLNSVVVSNEGAVVHDLTTLGEGGLILSKGTAERLFVSYTGTSSACTVTVLAAPPVLRDSVCWSHRALVSAAGALAAASVGATGTIVLRNDTLIAATSEGNGLHAQASSTGRLTVDATNVIADGPHGDVEAILSGTGVLAAVNLANSVFQTAKVEGGAATPITAPGTNGNLTAAPTFVDAASGNFAEATGSPTIDAGLTDSLIGATDLLGNPRSLPSCIGGTPVPDIGAYEFVPTVACPTPPPTPTPTPSNAIKLGKLTKDVKKGTATLLVTVPDAGQLTLSGKGVKKVTRGSKGAAKLKLPITPVGSAKKKLATVGSAKLSLTLRFVPTGGTAAKRAKSVKLVKSLR
jgi:hypothetical protein